MAYTPELNQKYSAILRRIAWGLEKPMTKALLKVIDDSVKKIDRNIVCENCKDKSYCQNCVFIASE